MANYRHKWRFWDEDFGYKYVELGDDLPTQKCLLDEYEQCTGLTDKNGNLIYEGDIVVPWYDPQHELIIKWDDNTVCFRLWKGDKMIGCKIDNSSSSPFVYNSKQMIIKGNIHKEF